MDGRVSVTLFVSRNSFPKHSTHQHPFIFSLLYSEPAESSSKGADGCPEIAWQLLIATTIVGATHRIIEETMYRKTRGIIMS